MQIFRNWLRRWRDYTGQAQLTLMGELTICNSTTTQLLTLTQEERSLVEECEQALRERFPYLEIEREERMVETTLKFFTYKHFLAEAQFLETFRSLLAVVLHKINSSLRLRARFMASGTFIDSRQEQKFSYLSKEDMVEYKITAKRPAGTFNVILKQRLKAYGMVVLLVLLALYLLYLNLPKQQIHDFLLPTIDV